MLFEQSVQNPSFQNHPLYLPIFPIKTSDHHSNIAITTSIN